MTINIMFDRQLNLKTEVGNIGFFLRKASPETGVFDFDVKCEMNDKFRGFYPQRSFCRLYTDDLRKLVQYFRNHCVGLENGTLSESPVYMPLEADLQIRCLDGDVENDEGYFSVCILFNCGKQGESGSNNYFGFESVIELSELKIFCSNINKLL